MVKIKQFDTVTHNHHPNLGKGLVQDVERGVSTVFWVMRDGREFTADVWNRDLTLVASSGRPGALDYNR